MIGNFYTFSFHRSHNLFIHLSCHETICPNLIYIYDPNMLPKKFKIYVICSCIYICDPSTTYAFMSRIDKGMEILKHITLEIRLVVTIYIPSSQIFIMTIKSHINTSHSWENLSNEWTTSNSGIMAFNLNNIFTLISKRKLDLVEVMVGASNVIFMKRVKYSNNTCLTRLIMDIRLVLIFHNILLPLISMISANFVNSKCLLGLWLK